MQRYFASDLKNNKFILQESDIFHIKKVMRMNIHDKIEVVYDNIVYLCEIKDNYEIEKLNIISDNKTNSTKIFLASALIKEQKQDFVLQKATELGVDTIIPLSLNRCVVKLDNDKFNKKKERWLNICKEASEQSKRNNIPNISDILTIKDLVKIDADLKIVLNTKEFSQTLKNVLNNQIKCDRIIIVVGPEGGITDEEIKFLTDNGFCSVSIGDNILRAETACISVISMINYHFMR